MVQSIELITDAVITDRRITATITFDGAATAPRYDVADFSRVVCLFRDESLGVPVDPGTVRAKVRDPRGAIKTHTYPISSELVKVVEGIYRIEVLFDKPGEWCIRFEGLGTNRAGEERRIQVRDSCFYKKPSGAEIPDAL
jgi:hypothetical protein